MRALAVILISTAADWSKEYGRRGDVLNRRRESEEVEEVLAEAKVPGLTTLKEAAAAGAHVPDSSQELARALSARIATMKVDPPNPTRARQTERSEEWLSGRSTELSITPNVLDVVITNDEYFRNGANNGPVNFFSENDG